MASTTLAVTSAFSTRHNNLDVLRLFAAGLVLYGHSFIFLGQREPLFLSWIPLGPLGVYIFFTISGYLVSQSWDRDPHLFRFFIRRGLRIFPGLTVCTIASIFILGPALTTLPLKDYFLNPHTWGYFQNISLHIVYYLPGVFSENRIPNAVNGSLWSLPVEFLMYIIVAILGILSANRWVVAGLAIASALLTLHWVQTTDQMLVFYNFDLRQTVLCGTFFWAGAVFQKFDLHRYVTLSSVVMAGVLMLCLERWTPLLQMAAWVLLPWLVLSFGLSTNRLLARITITGDYSYGIYIYAFPIQQTIIFLWPNMEIFLYIVICTLLTSILAVISWHLVEHPLLRLKPNSAKKRPKFESIQSA